MSSKNQFIYGVVSYIVFLVSFLYAIPFIGGFWVSKTIDTGVQTSFTNALVINLILMSLFAVQHSVMARPGFKKWLTKRIPPSIERSTYVLLSSLILLLLYWQWRPMTATVWEFENSVISFIFHAIYAIGWTIVFLSTFMINHFELFGLKQVYENLKNTEPNKPRFMIRHLYSFVRHPIMLGFIIAFWATPVMTVGHLLFAAVTTAYVYIAVRFFEEPDLVKIHGEEYREYQKNVPMIFPGRNKG